MTTDTEAQVEVVAPAMEFPENVKAFFEGITEVLEDRHNKRLFAMKKTQVVRVIEGIYDDHCRCFLEFLYTYYLRHGERDGSYGWKSNVKMTPASATWDWGNGIHHPVGVPHRPTNVRFSLYYDSEGALVDTEEYEVYILCDPVYSPHKVTKYIFHWDLEDDKSELSPDGRGSGGNASDEPFYGVLRIHEGVEYKRYAVGRIRAENAFGLSPWGVSEIVDLKPEEEE